MKNLLSLFSSAHVSALGWTLLHSLWQAALLGLVAVAGFYLLRRRSAQSRYTLGVAALGTQILASVATYFYYLPAVLQNTATSLTTYYQFTGTAFTASGPVAPVPMVLQVQLWLATHLSELVICWLIGVGVLLLRFAGGWFYLERLRFVSRPVSDRGWQARFGVLVARLDIGRAVELRETARIVTPMVVGVLRPVVLVPIGLLAGLSVAQVEAILAHELAHIRRHDYLVNLMQSFVEVVYFFHPVLWWLSARIRAEREHCCDDLAMAVCEDRMSLAHALVRVAEFRNQPALVVAFAGNKRQLLSRVRRVLGVAEPSSRRLAGYLPMAVVLLSLSVGASVYGFQGEDSIEEKTDSSLQAKKHIARDSDKEVFVEKMLDIDVFENININVDTLIEAKETEKYSNQPGIQRAIELAMAEQNSGQHNQQVRELLRLARENTISNNDTLQKKMAEYHAKIEALQKEMQPYQEEMQKLQQQMQPLHQRIDDLNLQVEKEHFAVERFQREEQKLEWKKDQLMQTRQQIMEKSEAVLRPRNGQARTSAAEAEKQLAEFESQIKAKEQEIMTLNDQIKQNHAQAKEAEKPMDDLNAKMEEINREAEVYSRKMEEIGRKMEVVGRKMEKVAGEMGLESMNFIDYNSNSSSNTHSIRPVSPSAPAMRSRSIRGTAAPSVKAIPSAPVSPAPTPKPPLPPKKKD